ETALVGDGDRVYRRRGDDDASLDGGAGLAGARRGRAARAGARAPAGGQDAAQHGHGHAQRRAAAKEVPPGQSAGDEVVDDVLLDGSPPSPKAVKSSVVDVLGAVGVHDTPLD